MSHEAAPMISSTQSSHACHVGNGSTAAWYRSKAYAAPTAAAICTQNMAGA